MSNKGFLAVIVLVIVGAVLMSAVYYVDEREKAIVFQFGEIVRSNDEPGLHFKTPFINNVRFFDARIQTVDAEPQRFLTGEKKNLIVDSFVKWRISDVHKYFTTLGGLKSNAENRIAQRVNDALRREFGRRDMQQVISGDRTEIMDTVRTTVGDEIVSFGIEVVDVRVKRVDLPVDVSERVYARMVAERSRVAKELRAQGAEVAEQIRANADRQRQILLANANRDGEQIRGEGDARATAIFADAFGQDREFYQLYRSLSAYRETFADPSNLLVIEPKSEFFRYFNSSTGEN